MLDGREAAQRAVDVNYLEGTKSLYCTTLGTEVCLEYAKKVVLQ